MLICVGSRGRGLLHSRGTEVWSRDSGLLVDQRSLARPLTSLLQMAQPYMLQLKYFS